MKENFQTALKAVLKDEGGFVNNPKDPGGATNKGITQAVYDAYRVTRKLIKQSVALITDDEVEAIYRARYWDMLRCDSLPHGLDYCVFDFGVNSGTFRAARYLQEALGLSPDGMIGPQTLKAAGACDVPEVIKKICDERMAFLKRLKTWDTFGKGWERRVESVESISLRLSYSAAIKDAIQKPETAPTTPIFKPRPSGLWGWLKSLFN